MSSPAPPKPGPDPTNPTDPQATDEAPLDPELPPPAPPDEEFWEKYNGRFEFPFSSVGAVLLHVSVALLLVFIWMKMEKKAPNKDLPVVISPIDGLDPFDGAPGAGTDNADQAAQEDKFETPTIPPEDLQKLPDVLDTIKDVLPDPDGNISKDKLADFANVDKDLAKKLARGDGTHGKGPGGLGENSAAGQSLRWTLRFRTRSARDYIYQLSVLGAQLFIPLSGDKRYMLYEDLSGDPPRGRLATDEDIKRLSGQVRFSDRDRDSVRQMAGALGLNETPKIFYAFMPLSIRDDIAAKERAYAGLDPRDIGETIVQMNVGGGKYDARVIEQRDRRGKPIQPKR
jgi:hypothetical protein